MEEKNEKELLADLYNKVNNIEQLLKQILSIHYPPYSSFNNDEDKPEPTAEELENENKLKFEMLYDNDIDFEEYDIESELKKFAESNNEVIDMTFDDILEDQKQQPQESTEESTEESTSTQ